MFRRFSVNFAIASIVLDSLAVSLSLKGAELIRPMMNRLSWIEPLPAYVTVPANLYTLFPLAWIFIYLILSIYDGRKYLRAIDEFSALSLAMLIASVFSAGLLYISYREVSRALFFLFLMFVYLACFTWRLVTRVYFQTQKAYPAPPRHVLVVGAGALGQRVRKHLLEAPLPNMTFAGFVEDDLTSAGEHVRVLGGAGDVRSLVAIHGVTDVVIALPHSEYHQLAQMVQKLEDLPIQVWVALGFFDLTLYNTAIEDFAGIPMLDLRASAIDDYQRIIKRAFDLILGSIGLIITTPLIALSAVLIILDDGFPVCFRQSRVGENGRIFEMLKLRTMIRGAERLQSSVVSRDNDGNVLHKKADDPRVTRAGRLLRRFSLDELPQLINVVRGEMSLVGPRPELPSMVENYQPWQRKRFSVPPGITGWWQVSGRSDRPMHLHTEDDLYYIQNYSILLDIQILFITVWVVIIGRGAY
jgi:exopolysaccharide biosynthesis polyprenyl glycosylphosphotransferase